MYRHCIIQDSLHHLEFKADGRKLTYQWDDEPFYHECTLQSEDSYKKLVRRVFDIRHEYSDDPATGWRIIDELLGSNDIYEFVIKVDDKYLRDPDLRSVNEIGDYLDEAYDKVWLMRNCYISTREPMHKMSRKRMERILRTYPDIPKDGYTDWECGYWNGILGALRWVLQDEKDSLDT